MTSPPSADVSNDAIVATYDRLAAPHDRLVAPLEAGTPRRAIEYLDVEAGEGVIPVIARPE